MGRPRCEVVYRGVYTYIHNMNLDIPHSFRIYNRSNTLLQGRRYNYHIIARDRDGSLAKTVDPQRREEDPDDLWPRAD